MPLSFLHRLVLAIVLAGTFHSAKADDTARTGTRPAGEQAAAERQEPAKGVLRLLPVDAVTNHSIDTRLYGYQDTQHGFFVDQLWCNLAPLFFEKVYILKDYGYNMAPWNLHERRIKEINGEEYILSNGEPLVFYHFSSFDYFRPGLLSWKYDRYSFENCPGIGKICSDYCKRLKENGIETLAKLPCALDIRKPRSPSLARRLIRKAWNKT